MRGIVCSRGQKERGEVYWGFKASTNCMWSCECVHVRLGQRLSGVGVVSGPRIQMELVCEVRGSMKSAKHATRSILIHLKYSLFWRKQWTVMFSPKDLFVWWKTIQKMCFFFEICEPDRLFHQTNCLVGKKKWRKASQFFSLLFSRHEKKNSWKTDRHQTQFFSTVN